MMKINPSNKIFISKLDKGDMLVVDGGYSLK